MVAIALHGGAGDRQRENTSSQQERELKEGIEAALHSGYEVLNKGGHCIDATEKAVMMLENFPSFNAGVGAALNNKGEVELDAGIFDGARRRTGAVTGVKRIKSPIQAARFVMDQTQQVLFMGAAAEALAEDAGLKMVENSYFITKEVREKYENDLLERGVTSCHYSNEKVVLGTVGVVALDSKGNTCSANSTGGIMHKPAGRIGDTPICGAGMYARNGVGAAACTGHGEFFVRTVAAYEALNKVSHGLSLDDALQAVLDDIQSLGGRGGMIGVDAKGNISMRFTTTSMVRAAMNAQGKRIVEIW